MSAHLVHVDYNPATQREVYLDPARMEVTEIEQRNAERSRFSLQEYIALNQHRSIARQVLQEVSVYCSKLI